jgi:signal transduction histidine kinase
MPGPPSNPVRAVVILLATGVVSAVVALAAIGIAVAKVATTRRVQDAAAADISRLEAVIDRDLEKRSSFVLTPDAESASDAPAETGSVTSVLDTIAGLQNDPPAKAAAARISAVLREADGVAANVAELRQRQREHASTFVAAVATTDAAVLALRECISRAEGRQRIREAGLSRSFRDGKGGDRPDSETLQILDSHDLTHKLHSLAVEVFELALLCERLRSAAHIDELAGTRDNGFLPSLVRFARSAEAIEADAPGATAALGAVRAAIFGAAMRLDQDHQTIVESSEGLFSSRRDVLADQIADLRLRARHAELLSDLRHCGASAAHTLSLQVQAMSRANDISLLRTWLVMAALSIASMGSFVGLGVRVARTTRAQFAAIQAANQTLEANERALKSANGQLELAATERAALHDQLLVASRQAGMAEVATGVLHNVGNVLNSVNVSASVMTKKLRASEVANLVRAGDLIHEHLADLPAFLSVNDRGKHLPGFLIQVSKCLADEQQAMLRELASVTDGIEHIKQVVRMQQTHAKHTNVIESVAPAELMDAALQMQQESLARHEMNVRRQFESLPPMPFDKHQVLQILVNLITNAKHAMRGLTDKGLTVAVRMSPHGEPRSVCFEVTDSGVGIPAENLDRIFAHGFTTRKDGHGFGLHSAANAARAMGGSLTASSPGPGKGATFRLVLPVAEPPPVSQAAAQAQTALQPL